jgi:hypothetical protein
MKTLILNWVFNEFMLWIASKRLGFRFYLYHQSVFQTGQRWIAYLFEWIDVSYLPLF